MKIMPAALLLCLSLGVYAQDEDLSEDAVAEDETAEVVVPSTPTDKKTFHRVQLGYTGTIVKYNNFGNSPDYNNYFLNGIGVGWMGDLRIAKKIDLFLELGANFTYHMGNSKDKRWNVHHDEYYQYKVNAFTVSIPVNINKQFKNAFGVKDLTLAPFVGLNFRFNVMAKRKATAHQLDGTIPMSIGNEKKVYTASLMKTDRGPEDFGESTPYMTAFDKKLHVGKLLQPGAQIGVNAYYNHYYLGVSYMYDLVPFSKHKSSPELTTRETPEGGLLPNIGTNCNEKVTTSHNFALTVGYVF